jgi:hypothetical protein
MGMKPKMAELMLEMYEGFNAGLFAPTRALLHGTTRFEEFAKEFAAAFKMAE